MGAIVQLQPDDRFLRLSEVRSITGRSKTQIYDDPTFPRPIKLSRRESAWIESEVRAWMQARVDAARWQQDRNKGKSENPDPTALGGRGRGKDKSGS